MKPTKMEIRVNPDYKNLDAVRIWAKEIGLKVVLDPEVQLELLYIVDPSYMHFEEVI